MAKMDKNTMLLEIHVEAAASEADQPDVLYRAREDAIEKLQAAEEKGWPTTDPVRRVRLA